MKNHPSFFGKDASNLPTWDKEITNEVRRLREQVEQVGVDLNFLLILLREGYRER